MNLIKMSLLGLVVAVIVAVWYMRKDVGLVSDGRITIGILQTASHPALDAARDGFMQELKNKMGSKVDFIIQNAQGSIANAHMIAQRFHKNANIGAMYAIATPAAQALVAVEKQKPVLIAAVTDSAVLGEQDNIYGVCDMIDMSAEIAMIRALLPELKTLAVIYSNAEANSITQVQQIKKECLAQGIDLLDVGVSQESDLSSAVAMACRKADGLLCPTDNMVASAMSLIVSIANNHKKPLFACHNQAVEQGALAARGVDYLQCGQRVGQIAYELLSNNVDGIAVHVEQAPITTIYVNKKTLQDLDLVIPETISADVVLVEMKD